MISLISREVVENKRWITDKEMGDIVIIAESTPGAIAINTATYVGYKTGGVLGSIFATLGVVLPSLIIISIIYVFFDLFKENKWFAAAFNGIRATVIVLLFNAVLKLSRLSSILCQIWLIIYKNRNKCPKKRLRKQKIQPTPQKKTICSKKSRRFFRGKKQSDSACMRPVSGALFF